MERLLRGFRVLVERHLSFLTCDDPLFGVPPTPFWSADSRSLAFHVGGVLKRADLDGGEPFSIAGVPGRRAGGDWNRFGVILVGSATGIKRVPASGGPLTAVTTTNASDGEDFHGFPKFLPDAKHFLYLGHSPQGSPGQSAMYVSSLDDGAHRVKILETAYGAVYAPGSRDPNQGWLLFINGTTLMAQAFDAGKLKVQGEATMVGQGVALDALFGHADVSVSATGVLAYGPSLDSDPHRLAWYDRKGTAVRVIGEPAGYLGLRISPDGRSVVALRRDPEDGHTDLWLADLARGASTRLTFSGSSSNAAWSPDSTAIVWGKVGLGLHHKRVNGGAEEPLLPGDAWHPSWSPDGRAIAFTMPQGADISVLPLGPAGTAEPGQPYAYIKSPLPESRAEFSPDGRWVAYQSQESGTPQVYVQPFPATGARWRISVESGTSPRWASAQELFYVQGRTLMAVGIAVSGNAIVAGTPAELFEVPRANLTLWDVARGGQRILAGERAGARPGARPITVVMNWQESLRK